MMSLVPVRTIKAKTGDYNIADDSQEFEPHDGARFRSTSEVNLTKFSTYNIIS